MRVVKVCVIGAGPAGLITLKALKSLDPETHHVVCFERHAEVGGTFNYKGKHGMDEDGMPVHSAMYQGLLLNAPKEGLEFPGFTFDETVKESFPSYTVVLDRLKEFGRVNDLQKYIQFQKWIENVEFSNESGMFNVTVKDLPTGAVTCDSFHYVIVATGHFSEPNVISYPGQETFPGRVIHSKDFVDAARYKGKSILIVGSSFSAEDLSLKSMAAGAERVTISHHSPPLPYNWPHGIHQKPIPDHISSDTVHFTDGSAESYDVIIYCTGYLHSFPFLEESLRLNTHNRLAPPLYQQIVSPANSKLFYIGMQQLLYTFPMFWLQGHFCAKVISGKISVPSKEGMLQQIDEDQAEEAKVKHLFDLNRFQTNYCERLSELTGQKSCNREETFKEWAQNRLQDINNFRKIAHETVEDITL